MTWSYSMNPAVSDRDAVRYLCGDTCFEDQQTTDEEIDWVLTEESNVYLAAAQICGTISAMYARRANKSIGDLKIQYSTVTEQYKTRAAMLEMRGATRGALPYAGGISKDDRETVEETEDRFEPFAERKLHDAPGALYEPNRNPIDEIT